MSQLILMLKGVLLLMRIFTWKLFVLSICMLLIGFFIGYSYSTRTDGSNETTFFKKENSKFIQNIDATPVPLNLEQGNENDDKIPRN